MHSVVRLHKVPGCPPCLLRPCDTSLWHVSGAHACAFTSNAALHSPLQDGSQRWSGLSGHLGDLHCRLAERLTDGACWVEPSGSEGGAERSPQAPPSGPGSSSSDEERATVRTPTLPQVVIGWCFIGSFLARSVLQLLGTCSRVRHPSDRGRESSVE